MARLLRQSTAFTFRIGPFLDSTDGVTAETALTIAQADIQISKAGGAFAQTSAAPTTTHDTDGWYQCPLTTTDTNTLGSMTVQVVMTGALPVWEHFVVIPAMVYDSLVAGSDTLDVQVTGMGDDTLNAAALAADAVTEIQAGLATAATLTSMSGATFDGATDSLEAIRNRGDAAWTTGSGGTPPELLQATTIATLATQTSFTLTAGSADDNAYNGCTIVFTDVSTSTQKAVGVITDYVGSTRTVTLLAAPAFTIAATDNVSIVAGVNAIAVAGSAPQTAVTIRQEIDSNSTQLAAILEDTATTIPALLTTIDTVVDRIEVDTQDLQTQIGTDGAGLTNMPWNAAWDAEVQSEVNDGLIALHLDHLLAADYDPASKPGVETALLNEIVESNAGVSRFTAPALAQAPSGTGASAAAIREEIDANSTQLAAIRVDTEDLQTQIGTDGAGLTAIGDTRMGNLDAAISTRAAAAALTTVDNEIATLQATADAIEADTSNIQSRIPAALNNGVMPADVQRIKDTALTGTPPFDTV